MRQLVVVAEQHPDCDVRINGEPAVEWSIVLQRQIAVIGKDLVRIDRPHDPANRLVLNLPLRGRHATTRPVSFPRCARSDRALIGAVRERRLLLRPPDWHATITGLAADGRAATTWLWPSGRWM